MAIGKSQVKLSLLKDLLHGFLRAPYAKCPQRTKRPDTVVLDQNCLIFQRSPVADVNGNVEHPSRSGVTIGPAMLDVRNRASAGKSGNFDRERPYQGRWFD